MELILMLHPSKSDRRILEPTTQHTGLGLVYFADISSLIPMMSEFTFNST
jgi:hypothetical protein